MAFDMHCQGQRECIGHHEEGLFEFVRDNDRFPKLNWIWEQFYDGPRIDPASSNAIVHELIELRSAIQPSGDKTLLHSVDRLLPFFSSAAVSESWIQCSSD